LKNIYFISESIPHPGYGSFIIFYRHLIRLEQAGYKINIIMPDYKGYDDNAFYKQMRHRWQFLRVPFKKWWFLFPYVYDNALSRGIRLSFVYLFVRKHIKKNIPDFIITYFNGTFLNGFGVFLKKKYNCPAGIFLHDDKHLLANTTSIPLLHYDQYLSDNADVIWTVSKELFIPQTDKRKYTVLYPIPEGTKHGIKRWHDEYATPVVGFSGGIFNEYELIFNSLAKSLAKHKGQLHLIIQNPTSYEWLSTLTDRHSNVRVIPSFVNVREAFEYLRSNCTALFCGYPNNIEKMPWIKTCFPSKFIEFSHLSLPVILMSAEGTSLKNWAIENNWTLFSSDYSDIEIDKLIEGIITKKGWLSNSAESIKVASTIFDPEHIQEVFQNSIMPK
jgi:hypothetical protein